MTLSRWTLTALALLCVAGCAGKTVDRTYPACQGVLSLTDASWVFDADGNLRLVEGTWRAEAGLGLDDIRYNWRNAYLLTPGFVDELMKEKNDAAP